MSSVNNNDHIVAVTTEQIYENNLSENPSVTNIIRKNSSINRARHKLYVIKRDLTEVPVRFDEITDRLAELCDTEPVLDFCINPFEITQDVIERIRDGITTSEIDNFTAEICANNMKHPDYGNLASRLVVSSHHKNIQCSTGILFSEVVKTLYNNTDNNNQSCPLVNDQIYDDSKDGSLDNIIDLKRDFLLDFFGFKTLMNSYLLKLNKKQKNGSRILVTVEGPQHMFLRVALAIHQKDLIRVRQTYDLLSLKYFTHASPTLFNAGTPKQQLFSCFLLNMEDSLKGIFKCITDTAHISKWAGGIGISIQDIRGSGSYIRGTAGRSDGIIPMLKVLNDTARYINQGGKRLGSFAVYLEPWHSDIMEFLECKLNNGSEEKRARDLFYALWIPDIFMTRVLENGIWSLMCPSECPGLTECYGKKFDELYTSYEKAGRFKKQMRALEVWDRIINTQIETGVPYMLYKDACNLKSNHKHLGTIKSSNLCAEIIEYNDTKKYACCVLASIVLSTCVNDKTYDYNKLYEVSRVIVRNLDNIIDLNYYPVPETEVSNLSERPLGLGVQDLAGTFFKLGLPYDSPEAASVNKKIFETIYFAALTESCQLAIERGKHPSFEGSPMSQGIFQFDMWSGPGPNSNVELSGLWDWSVLKENIKKHGLRNSLLTALMPTASTAQIMGSTEAFEPINSNIYTRRVLAGDYVVTNKYLTNDLIRLGLWSEKMSKKLVKHRGSIQNIKEIPQDIKDLYKTVWEIKQKVIIDMAADRGPFVDQSQSMNLFFEKPTNELLSKAHIYAYKKGLKTGSYYIRSKPASNAEQFTIDSDDEELSDDEEEPSDQRYIGYPEKKDEDACIMCSG